MRYPLARAPEAVSTLPPARPPLDLAPLGAHRGGGHHRRQPEPGTQPPRGPPAARRRPRRVGAPRGAAPREHRDLEPPDRARSRRAAGQDSALLGRRPRRRRFGADGLGVEPAVVRPHRPPSPGVETPGYRTPTIVPKGTT